MHRVSSALAARYPQGIPSRRIVRARSTSPALFRKIPVRQGVRADSHGRMQGAHLSDAQRFDWLGMRVVHIRAVDTRTKRDARSARIPCSELASLRPVACSNVLIGLTRPTFAKIRTQLVIRANAHLVSAQRFASFWAAVVHMSILTQRRPPHAYHDCSVAFTSACRPCADRYVPAPLAGTPDTRAHRRPTSARTQLDHDAKRRFNDVDVRPEHLPQERFVKSMRGLMLHAGIGDPHDVTIADHVDRQDSGLDIR